MFSEKISLFIDVHSTLLFSLFCFKYWPTCESQSCIRLNDTTNADFHVFKLWVNDIYVHPQRWWWLIWSLCVRKWMGVLYKMNYWLVQVCTRTAALETLSVILSYMLTLSFYNRTVSVYDRLCGSWWERVIKQSFLCFVAALHLMLFSREYFSFDIDLGCW